MPTSSVRPVLHGGQGRWSLSKRTITPVAADLLLWVTTSAGAPFVLELLDRDAGRTVEVLRGGKVIVTLPDPDGSSAGVVRAGRGDGPDR